MTRISVSVRVSAPIDRVFDRFADIARHPDVMDGVLGVQILTEGAFRVGTRFKLTRKMFGKAASETMEVTRIDRPNRMELTAEANRANYLTVYAFEREGTPDSSRTIVTMTFGADPQGILGKALAFLTRPLANKMRSMMEGDLNQLRDWIESDTD